jgi:PAS domain S-box-containing protein
MPGRSGRAPRNERILHIEDNRENRMLVRAILEADGYTIVDAEDGLSGIEAAIREQPDLILLDVNLPGVDGYEVVSIIKSFPSIAATPVIAVTAYAMEGDRQRTLVAGCDGYIQKPIDVDAFPGQVAEFLRGKREHLEEREEGVYLREMNQRLVYRLVNQVEELKRLNQHFVRRASQLADLHRAVQDITSEVGVRALLETVLPQLGRALGTSSLTVELADPPGVRVEVAGGAPERPRSVLQGAVPTGEEWVEVEWQLALSIRDRKLGTMVARQLVPPGAKADEEQLLNIVANQLAIAIENSRLYESMTHRAAEQESLVAAGRLLTGTLQVSAVLQRLAELVRSRLGGVVRIWLGESGDELRLSAQAGETRTPADESSGSAPAQVLAQWVLSERARLVVPCLADDARVSRRDWVEAEGFVSFLGVPLVLEGEPVGILSVLTREPRAYRPEELRFAEALAVSAAAAIRNAGSYEETQAQLHSTETLLAVSQAVGSTMELTEVLRRTARSLARALGADTAGGWLLTPTGDRAVPLVGYHVPKDVAEMPLPTSHPLIDEVRRTKAAVYASESRGEPRFQHPLANLVAHRSLLIQPIVLKADVIGFFALAWLTEAHLFTPDELRLSDGIARQAAIAVDNARLLDAERQARAELEASETRYRELFENALDIVYLHGLDGRLLAVNDAGVQASGYSRGELLGMNIGELMEPEGVPGGAAELTRRMLAGAETAELQAAQLHTKSGHRRPLECRARLVVKDGVPVAIQGVARDITVRRRLEERQGAFVDIVKELAAEGDFERLFSLIGRRVCELSDADSAVISLVEGDELVVRGLYNFAQADAMTPRRPLARSRVGRVVMERRPYASADMVTDPHWQGSTLIRLGYRAILDVPIILRDKVIGVLGVRSNAPRVFSDEDVALLLSLAGHTAVAIDRTNLLRELTERLAESQTLLRVSQAVSSTLDLAEMMRRVAKETAKALGADMVGAYLADADRTCLRPIAGYQVPPPLLETLTNEPIPLRGHRFLEEAWERQEPVASSDTAADPRLDRATLARIPHRSLVFAPTIVRGEPIGGLFVVWWDKHRRLGADELRLVEGIASQAAVAIENSRLYEGVKRQMTELKQTQAQLIQSTKLAAIGELAANIAHEINNPLTTVLGFASFLTERLPPGAPTLEELRLIQEEAARARDIVRDLLQFSRQSDFLPVMTDLNVVVEQVVGMLRRQGAVEHVTVTEVYGGDLPLAEVDVSRIKQVFLNIINNAIFAMPAGGELTIRTMADPAVVQIQFSDTGTGIEAENLAKIFDPFFTTKPDVSGTGLGLSVSLGIVQSHGGTIEVESQVGKGSTFTVKLPVEHRSAPPSDR